MNPLMIAAAAGLGLYLWQRQRPSAPAPTSPMIFGDPLATNFWAGAGQGQLSPNSLVGDVVQIGTTSAGGGGMNEAGLLDALGDAIAEGAPGTDAQSVWVTQSDLGLAQQFLPLITRGIQSGRLSAARRDRAIRALQQLGLRGGL
jgi:hypothetical protein